MLFISWVSNWIMEFLVLLLKIMTFMVTNNLSKQLQRSAIRQQHNIEPNSLISFCHTLSKLFIYWREKKFVWCLRSYKISINSKYYKYSKLHIFLATQQTQTMVHLVNSILFHIYIYIYFINSYINILKKVWSMYSMYH